MRTIELDARGWNTVLDFYDALATVLGSPAMHGRGFNAFIDSMIYGKINEVEPPYIIRIVASHTLPTKVREEIELLARGLQEHRKWRRDGLGLGDAEVSLVLDESIM